MRPGMRRYTVVLIPDLEDGGYVVTVPALPGCVTEGGTFQEAGPHSIISCFVLEKEGTADA